MTDKHHSPLIETYWQYPIEAVRADGVYLSDKEGRQYLDFYGGHCACPLGHCPKPVVDAIANQAREFLFYSNQCRIPIRSRAAEILLDFAASAFTKVFFCNSGGEANENALKISILATGRSKFAAFKNAFHGRTMLALSVTDNPKWHETYRACLAPVSRLLPNDMDGLSSIDEETAAVILEPIQSIGKCTVFSVDFLRALRERCNEVGALLIFDEVQTGLGRTGSPFVSGHWGVQPDMATSAKGLGGGFPMSAVLVTENVAGHLKVGDIAATFGGGPLAMAATMAAVREIKEKNLAHHALEMEQYLRERLCMPQIKEIRGKGLLLGLVLDREARPIEAELIKRGIIVGHNADPTQVHLLPPLTIQKEHIDMLHRELSAVLA